MIYKMDIKFKNDVKFKAKEEEIFHNCIWRRIVESIDWNVRLFYLNIDLFQKINSVEMILLIHRIKLIPKWPTCGQQQAVSSWQILLHALEELRAKVKIKDNDDMEEVEKGQDETRQTFQVKQTWGPCHQDRARLQFG